MIPSENAKNLFLKTLSKIGTEIRDKQEKARTVYSSFIKNDLENNTLERVRERARRDGSIASLEETYHLVKSSEIELAVQPSITKDLRENCNRMMVQSDALKQTIKKLSDEKDQEETLKSLENQIDFLKSSLNQLDLIIRQTE